MPGGYYTDEHVETILRRALVPAPLRKISPMLTISSRMRIEGVHPLQFGVTAQIADPAAPRHAGAQPLSSIPGVRTISPRRWRSGA